MIQEKGKEEEEHEGNVVEEDMMDIGEDVGDAAAVGIEEGTHWEDVGEDVGKRKDVTGNDRCREDGRGDKNAAGVGHCACLQDIMHNLVVKKSALNYASSNSNFILWLHNSKYSNMLDNDFQADFFCD